MKRDEIIKILKDLGWTFTEGAKHTRGESPDGTKTTRIWRHTRDLPIGTLKEIEKQTGVKFTK